MDGGSGGAGVLVLLVLVAFYFLPAIVAGNRKHRNAGAIFALNLLLGWTLLGWVVALVWALTNPAPVQAPVPAQPVAGSLKAGESFGPSVWAQNWVLGSIVAIGALLALSYWYYGARIKDAAQDSPAAKSVADMPPVVEKPIVQSTAAEPAPAGKKKEEKESPPPAPPSRWTYAESSDAMDDAATKTACTGGVAIGPIQLHFVERRPRGFVYERVRSSGSTVISS